MCSTFVEMAESRAGSVLQFCVGNLIMQALTHQAGFREGLVGITQLPIVHRGQAMRAELQAGLKSAGEVGQSGWSTEAHGQAQCSIYQ